ncbi:O-methyltransferase [Hymenobacter sp. BRD67]|uniref:O-methyltransferase n=1 Tax=Hymenobacter sp. BRD67 TaxID=2675877 RepID=UPI0015658CA2|nr:O-methyltransferase [Hymenobacter sp. BRD67]QKG52305.1 O-methyltransferase [Hymenobacter sp. BRD67]
MTDDAIQDYANAHSEPEPPLLHALWRETHLQLLMPRMATGHWQGRLLSMLSHLLKPRRVLEIGTFTGYATLCLAEGLPADGQLHTIEINPERESRIRRYVAAAGLTERVQLHIGDAADVLAGLVGEVWDLVFIDADKLHNSRYFELVVNQLRPGGLLIVDNVLWGGKALADYPLKANDHDTRAVRAFNEQVQQDPRVVPLLLPVRDGLLLLRKK